MRRVRSRISLPEISRVDEVDILKYSLTLNGEIKGKIMLRYQDNRLAKNLAKKVEIAYYINTCTCDKNYKSLV